MVGAGKYHVEVISLDFVEKGNLKAFADVKIGKSLRIFGFRIVQQPNQKAWVSPPQRTYEGKDGQPKYAPICELSGELKAEVEHAILAAWAQT